MNLNYNPCKIKFSSSSSSSLSPQRRGYLTFFVTWKEHRMSLTLRPRHTVWPGRNTAWVQQCDLDIQCDLEGTPYGFNSVTSTYSVNWKEHRMGSALWPRHTVWPGRNTAWVQHCDLDIQCNLEGTLSVFNNMTAKHSVALLEGISCSAWVSTEQCHLTIPCKAHVSWVQHCELYIVWPNSNIPWVQDC